MDRLQTFREVLARLDPTRPIRARDEQGWYVERPDKVATLVANTFHLEPASSHLVIGSIGCGKSTELLEISRRLMTAPDVSARYVEVSTIIDPKEATAADLLVALMLDLLQDLEDGTYFAPFLSDQVQAEHASLLEEVVGIQEGLRSIQAWGTRRKGPEVRPHRPDHPEEPPAGDLGEYQELLRDVRNFVRQASTGSLVWLLDGLDRLQDPLRFDELITPVLQVVKSVGIGLVVVAPRRVVSGLDRLGTPSDFDEIHAVAPVDPTPGTAGHGFLSQVLSLRSSSRLLPDEHGEELIRLSGGVLRMLLQITKQAIKEAYVRGEDGVSSAHVEVAGEKLGRDLVFGLDSSDVRVLLALAETGRFAGRTDEDFALVRSNRILEYMTASGQRRYAVHPCLQPLLPVLQAELEPRGESQPAFLGDDDIPF